MKKYPFVKQEELKDCGMSCIDMLIKYYKGNVRKQELLELTKTSKNGTTAYHLKEALINLGFEARGIKCSLNDINENNIILPCIANVIINDSYKHFIVIYEINFNKNYIIIGDPADRIKKITFNEFKSIFNNFLLIAYPIKNIIKQKDFSIISFMYNLIIPHKSILKNIFILSIFITFLGIFTSFYTEWMLNAVTFNSKNNLIFIFTIFFFIYILKIITDFFRNRLLIYINQKLDLNLTLDVFKKIIKLPYHYYQNKSTGDIVSRIYDLNNIKEVISQLFLTLFADLPLSILSIIILYIINSTLFFIGVIIIVLYFFIVLGFKNIFNKCINKIQSKRSEFTSFIVESINGFETVKGLNIENDMINRFEHKYVKYLYDTIKFQNIFYIQNLFKELVNNIGFIIIIFVGCLFVLDNRFSFGNLLTFSSMLIYFLEPIKNIINLDNLLKEARNSLKRILDIIYVKDKDNGIIDSFKNGNIVFKNIVFSFNDRDLILKNINLEIKKNSKVMVVGKSGSGKSTLFKLLKKYYKIENNKIFINGNDLNNYKKDIIDKNILYLGQNEILFNDTLYNNLIFDDSDCSKLLDIETSCCISEILDSNLGYNMLIEENGFNLSGGERQRIVLARALLKKFSILIIDEGLNQVDIDVERCILKNIFTLYKDKTIIMISHRLDNLDLFDQLIEINNGVVNRCEIKGN